MQPMPATLNAFFLPGSALAGGQRFALHHAPPGPARGAVLYLHPFAEEMNKSRRMAALAARALAGAGWGVLQIDLLGCGDSSGDFGDATWAHWVDDAVLAAQWLQARHAGPLWLWGQRAGCLLAAEAARRIAGPRHFVFWQPPASGKALLQQFLRLKMAAALQGGAARGLTEALKRELAAGQAVEVAGYRLGPGLAQGLEAASLQTPPAIEGARLLWLEATSREPAELLPASAMVLGRWQAAGYDVTAQAVAGPAFWQTVEIEEAPALVQATVAGLARSAQAVAA